MDSNLSDGGLSLSESYEDAQVCVQEHSIMPPGLAGVVLDALPDNIAVLDRSGTIVAVNAAWNQFARDSDANSLAGSIGTNYLAVCRANARNDVTQHVVDGLSAILAGAQMCVMLEYPCHSPTKQRWCLLRVMPASGDHAGAIVTQSNITARKLTEAEQARLHDSELAAERLATQQAEDSSRCLTSTGTPLANQELRRLQALTDTALAHLDLDALLPEVLDRVRDVMAVDNAVILLLDEESRQLRVRAAIGLEEAVAAQMEVPVGQGFVGRIAASRAPLIVDDLSTFPGVHPFLRERLHSAVGVPLLLHERVLGVLHIGTVEPHHFTEQDVQLLQRAAERVAVAVERAQLFETEQHARQEAQAALARARASETRFQRLVDSDIIGVVVGDAEHAIDANDAYLQMLGYTREDLQAGKLTPQMLSAHEDMLASAGRSVLEALTTGACPPFECEYTRKDGSRVPVLVGIALLQQEPPLFGCFMVDLTERKRLEHEREEAQARELAAHEVAYQMDQFFALASHDIRAPVTAVGGLVQLARTRATRLVASLQAQDGKATEVAVRLLDSLAEAEASTNRLARMTELLFDVARARSGTFSVSPAPCDLAGIVREQVEAQRLAVPERTIHLDLPAEEPLRIVADADRLGQVLANFLANALKYSPNDQPVDVRVHHGEGRVRVAVHDHGPGLPPEEQARVWEMFHRAPGVAVQGNAGAMSGSLGLGLHVCKRIVEAHPGGWVGIKSAVGKGSTFWFDLPLADRAD